MLYDSSKHPKTLTGKDIGGTPWRRDPKIRARGVRWYPIWRPAKTFTFSFTFVSCRLHNFGCDSLVRFVVCDRARFSTLPNNPDLSSAPLPSRTLSCPPLQPPPPPTTRSPLPLSLPRLPLHVPLLPWLLATTGPCRETPLSRCCWRA